MTKLLVILSLLVVFVICTVHGEILNYDDDACIVDKELDPEEEGNYVDCNTEEAIADKNTRCCDIEGAAGCCPDDKNAKFIAICTSIAIVTAATMTACFIVFWCNPQTIPWLKNVPCCKCLVHKDTEFGEMSDLSEEIKKQGEFNSAYVRNTMRDEDLYAPPERYDMPDELKANVQDDWWGTSASREAAF